MVVASHLQIWVSMLIFQLQTPFYCNSKSAIYIEHNEVFHEHTKQIEIVVICARASLAGNYCTPFSVLCRSTGLLHQIVHCSQISKTT